ncbi:glycosyltransferase [Fibrobacterota bacterium]
MPLAPVAIFVYNRLPHLRKTVQALRENSLAGQSDVLIYSDGPKKDEDRETIKAIRSYVKSMDGFASVNVIEQKENLGLGNSIIAGVSETIKQHGKAIVLEDDLVTSPHFLDFMNDALHRYKDQEEVVCVSGYVYPLKSPLPGSFFIRGADCLGWATWKKGWDLFERNGKKLLASLEKERLAREFDFNGSYPYMRMLKNQVKGKNDSWAVRWYASAFLAQKLILYPPQSLVHHIGSDSSGTNCGENSYLSTALSDRKLSAETQEAKENVLARREFENYFNSIRTGRVISFLKRRLPFS